MKNICIAYDTVSGSTKDMADIIEKHLIECDHVVSSYQINKDSIVNGKSYDTLILGSPMRFGAFSSAMKKWIKSHKEEIKHLEVFCYFSMLYIVRIAEEPDMKLNYYIDPSLNMQIIPKKNATNMDKTHTLAYYDTAIKKYYFYDQIKGIAFLNGRLDLAPLPFVTRLFMKCVTMLTNKEKIGDFLNPPAVIDWAKQLNL